MPSRWLLAALALLLLDGVRAVALLQPGACPRRMPSSENLLENDSFEEASMVQYGYAKKLPSWTIDPDSLYLPVDDEFYASYPYTSYAHDGIVAVEMNRAYPESPPLVYNPSKYAASTKATHKYLLSMYIGSNTMNPQTIVVTLDKEPIGEFIVSGPAQAQFQRFAYTRYCLEIPSKYANRGDHFGITLDAHKGAQSNVLLDSISLQDMGVDPNDPINAPPLPSHMPHKHVLETDAY